MRPARAGRATSALGSHRRRLLPLATLLLAGCASQQSPPPQPVSETSAPGTTPSVEKPKITDNKGQAVKEQSAEPLSSEEGAIAEGEACLSCHSAELIQTARIGLAGWMAEMTKMRNWGALVDENKAAPLAAWFAQRYPAAEPEPAPAMISPSEAKAAVGPERDKQPLQGDRQAGAALYTKDCASCHGANAEGAGGGPVLIEAPAIYQRTRFTDLVLKGKGRMPAGQGIGDAEISNLLAFLRALR